MRVCYLILAHNQPSHFARLFNALDNPDAACYIHVDPKSRLSLFTSRVPHSAAQFIKRRVSVGWGRFSMVQATLNLIRTALTAPERHDYYGLLSGADYSIRSPAFVRQYLSEHAGNELTNMVPLPHKAASKSLRRITKLHVAPERVAQRFVPQPLARGVSKMVKALLLRRSHKRGLRGLAPYSGSQWWMLSRAALEHVWTFVQDNPWYTHYFTNVPIPDESFFQTIIGNSDYRRRTHRSFTFTDWSRPAPPYPAVIDEAHLPRFFDGGIVADDYYGRGPMLFARKFPDDSAHLTAAIRKHAW